MIRLLEKNESEDHGTFTRDDFFDYVNGEWAETAVIPDDKPSTGGFMDLIQDIENWCWISLENGKEEKNCSKIAFPCKTCQNHPKMVVQILMHGKQLVWLQPCPLINEIKALSSFEDYTSKLGAYELGLANQISCHLACHQTLWMPKWMSCGEKHRSYLARYDLLWRRQRKGPELLAIHAKWWKNFYLNLNFRGWNQRYPG